MTKKTCFYIITTCYCISYYLFNIKNKVENRNNHYFSLLSFIENISFHKSKKINSENTFGKIGCVKNSNNQKIKILNINAKGT